jgi:hypothetical protein
MTLTGQITQANNSFTVSNISYLFYQFQLDKFENHAQNYPPRTVF